MSKRGFIVNLPKAWHLTLGLAMLIVLIVGASSTSTAAGMNADANPLPSELRTPPVTKIYLVCITLPSPIDLLQQIY